MGATRYITRVVVTFYLISHKLNQYVREIQSRGSGCLFAYGNNEEGRKVWYLDLGPKPKR